MPVTSEHPEFVAAKAKWKRCRDAAAGTDAVKAATSAYLPILEGLKTTSERDYLSYINRALFYPATSRTVMGLLGLVFGKPATFEPPAAFADQFKDVTQSGVTIGDYARNVAQEVLVTGRAGILVDMPDKVARTARPYWVTYPAEAIRSWRTDRIDGKLVLTRVVLYEEEALDDEDDPFELKVKKQYRVLFLERGRYVVRVYVENTDEVTVGAAREEWIQEGDDRVPLRRGQPLPFIPFTFVNADGTDAGISHPPLLDLADVNFSHYRTSADQEHGAHYTALPTPVLSGYTPEPGETIAIGSGTFITMSDPAARAYMLEFSGAGLKTLADLKEEKRQMMVTLGARMLETQKNVQEAAATVAMRHAGERSALDVLAASIGAAVTLAARWHLFWQGVEEQATNKVSFILNPEVMEVLSADDVKVLVAAWQAGAISHKTLYENLQWGTWARENVTFEEEQADIEDEQPELPEVDDMGNPLPVVVPVRKVE